MNKEIEYYRPFGQPAVASVTFIDKLVAGDTITINGDVYTYGTDFFAPEDEANLSKLNVRFQIAQSLAAVINRDKTKTELFNAILHHNPIKLYYAVFYGYIVQLIATAPGTAANAYTLITSNTNAVTVSGATFVLGVDATGGSAVAVTSVVPGIGATNLGKAEDAPHTSGDVGVMGLGVRMDSDVSPVSADGDYQAFIFNNIGRLKVSTLPGATAATTGSITANGQTVVCDTSHQSGVYIQLIPTAIAGAAFVFEMSVDGGATYNATNAIEVATQLLTATASLSSTTLFYKVPVLNATNIRIRCTGFSGTSVAVTMLPFSVQADSASGSVITSGVLTSISTSITPGVGATNLGKAEDAVHASGDTGVLALTVRTDTVASTAGTTGDNAGIVTDGLGKVYVRASGGTAENSIPGSTTSDQPVRVGAIIIDPTAFPAAQSATALGSLQLDLQKRLLVRSSRYATLDGTTYFRNTALTNTATTVKITAGNVWDINVSNENTLVSYLKFFNVVIGSITVGTTVPVFTLQIPANGSLFLSNETAPIHGFSTAISVIATSVRADTGTQTAPVTALFVDKIGYI